MKLGKGAIESYLYLAVACSDEARKFPKRNQGQEKETLKRWGLLLNERKGWKHEPHESYCLDRPTGLLILLRYFGIFSPFSLTLLITPLSKHGL